MDRYIAAPSVRARPGCCSVEAGSILAAHIQITTAGEVGNVEWTMATQTTSWMTDAQWLCCKTCRTHSAQGGTFVVSSCGHIFCTSCKERGMGTL